MSVAVRALCEFTAKQGDLDLRFTPSPTAQEGIAGHAHRDAARRGGLRSEVRSKATAPARARPRRRLRPGR
jgi:DNA excision repair protein ERCC-2